MAKVKQEQKVDASTEEKIKAAAKKVFYAKGFAATRTRDIAEEAGINLALLNYYFRSKEKLFDVIMTETMHKFIRNILVVINEENTTLEQKTQQIANNYIDFLSVEPMVPIFIMSEIRNNPETLFEKLPIGDAILQSVFFKQHQEAVAKGKITEANPMHFIMNLIGLIIFPFLASPILKKIGHLDHDAFITLMQERKKWIPVWIKAVMKAK